MAAEYTAQATAIYEPFEEDMSEEEEANELNSPPDAPARTSTPGTSVHNGYRSGVMNPPTVPSKPVIKGSQGAHGIRPGTISGGISYRNVRSSTNAATADAPSVTGLNDLPGGNLPEGRRSGALNPHPYRTASMKRAYPHIDTELVKEKALRRSRSAATVTANNHEGLDKTEISSQEDTKRDWRKSIGNPGPISLLGTIISLAPLSCDLMGWGGATAGGQASIGAFFFFGGMLLTIAGLGEFVLGNTFSFVVDMTYSAFWLTLGTTLHPSFNAIGAYSPDPTKPALGLGTAAFNSSFAFILLFMGILSTVYFICALRTNICYVVIFLTLAIGFGLLTGQHFYISAGELASASTLAIAGGATLFVTCIAALWIFVSIMLEVLDFPLKIPVGDLSNFIKSNTVRMEEFRYLEDLRHIEEMRYMDKRQMQDMRYMM